MTRNAWSGLLLGAALLAATLVWFHSLLDDGLRSDDYLLVYYGDRHSGTVLWDRVLEEFVRPWFDAERLYRPLVSLSIGVEMWLWPGPAGMHATNVLLTATATIATALLARRLWAGGGPTTWIATAIAGALVVLHPAAVEPTGWILSRTTGLQVAFGTLACWLFVRHRDGRGGRAAYLSCLLLALLSKEGAVMLPLLFVLLEQLRTRARADTPPPRFIDRLRALASIHAPAFLVLAFYLLLRLLVLGEVLPSSASAPADERVANLAVRAGQLFAPPGLDGATSSWYWAWLLLLWPLGRCGLRTSTLLLALVLLPLLPTSLIAGERSIFYGRFLLDALPWLALLTAAAVGADGPQRRPVARALALTGAAVLLIAFAGASRQRIARYDQQDRTHGALLTALGSAAHDASPRRPFAFTGLPGLPLYHPELWGVLGLAPQQPRDLAVIALPELLFAPKAAPAMYGDATAARAILEDGGTLATWHDALARFLDVTGPTDGTQQLHRDAASERFLAASPWPGSSVAAIEVRHAPPGSEVVLQLVQDLPDARALPPRRATVPSADTADASVWFDTGRAFAPLLLHATGAPFGGVTVTVDGAPPAAAVEVFVHARYRQLAGGEALAGATVTLDELPERIARPARLTHDAHLYVLVPTGVRRMSGEAAPATAWATSIRPHVAYLLRLYHPLTVQWFWIGRERRHGPIARTPLDWATVTSAGEPAATPR